MGKQTWSATAFLQSFEPCTRTFLVQQEILRSARSGSLAKVLDEKRIPLEIAKEAFCATPTHDSVLVAALVHDSAQSKEDTIVL